MEVARVVLRKVADSSTARDKAKTVLKSNHFIDPKHVKIFSEIITLSDRGSKIITEEILLDHIVSWPKSDEYASEIGAIFIGMPPLDSEFEYALQALVNESQTAFVTKGLVCVADRITKGDTIGAIDLLSKIPDFYSKLAISSDRRQSARTMQKMAPDTDSERFKTGFQVIDEITGGGRLGEFWLWAAYVGEMKSNSLCAIAHSLFLAGKRVLYATLEMDSTEIKRRLLCQHAFYLKIPISYRYLENGVHDGYSEDNCEKAQKDFDENPEYGDIQIWHPSLGATIMDVAKEIEVCSADEETDCEVVIIDYVQKLSPLSKRKEFRHEVNEMLDRAKRIAMEARGRKGVFLVSGYQVSSEGRKQAEKDGYYNLYALSETLGAGQIANVVCWSLYTPAFRSRKEIKVGIAKSRNSSTDGSFHFLPVDPAVGLFAKAPIVSDSEDTTVDSLDEI